MPKIEKNHALTSKNRKCAPGPGPSIGLVHGIPIRSSNTQEGSEAPEAD